MVNVLSGGQLDAGDPLGSFHHLLRGIIVWCGAIAIPHWGRVSEWVSTVSMRSMVQPGTDWRCLLKVPASCSGHALCTQPGIPSRPAAFYTDTMLRVESSPDGRSILRMTTLFPVEVFFDPLFVRVLNLGYSPHQLGPGWAVSLPVSRLGSMAFYGSWIYGFQQEAILSVYPGFVIGKAVICFCVVTLSWIISIGVWTRVGIWVNVNLSVWGGAGSKHTPALFSTRVQHSSAPGSSTQSPLWSQILVLPAGFTCLMTALYKQEQWKMVRLPRGWGRGVGGFVGISHICVDMIQGFLSPCGAWHILVKSWKHGT